MDFLKKTSTTNGIFSVTYTSMGIPTLKDMIISPSSKKPSEVFHACSPLKSPVIVPCYQVLIDSGEAGTVVGADWVNQCNPTWKSNAFKSEKKYAFGSGNTFHSFGKVYKCLSLQCESDAVEYLFVRAEVIPTAVPFLLSLETLRSTEAILDFVNNTITTSEFSSKLVFGESGHVQLRLKGPPQLVSINPNQDGYQKY